MNFYKKLGEIRPNQLITTYGPGSIMDAVNDSLTVLDIEYWDTNNIGKEIRDARLASYMNVRRFFMPKTGGKEDIPVVSFPYYHVCSKGTCKFLFDMRDYFDMDQYGTTLHICYTRNSLYRNHRFMMNQIIQSDHLQT